MKTSDTGRGRSPSRSSERSHEPSTEDFTPFFKAFCNETRARIVEQLLPGERCVCEITAALDVSQPLISHHLATLRDAGFVRQRGEGARTYYSIDWDVFDGRLDDFRRHVEQRRQAGATGPPSCRPTAC